MNTFKNTLFWFAGLISLLIPMVGRSDMALAKSRAMDYREIQTLVSDAKKHFVDVSQKRPLTDNEKKIQLLLDLSSAMNVSKIITTHGDMNHLNPQNVVNSMIKKMHENPKWDAPLNAEGLKTLNTHRELLKTTFTDKTYGWAWYLKQNGETKAAKEILLKLFSDSYQSGVNMTHRGFGYSSPLSEMGYLSSALEPMCTAAENKDIEAKTQKVKTIYSNLPDSNIQT
jgi:hypothetical protein